jgi:hypothetical protein
MRRLPVPAEWPTLALLLAVYLVWGIGTTWLAGVSLPLAIAVTALVAALHASLTHEAIHGHPFATPATQRGADGAAAVAGGPVPAVPRHCIWPITATRC